MDEILTWKKDLIWANQFLPEIKRILGFYLIVEAPEIDDSEMNTDLIVLKLDAIRIAVRIRKHLYLEKYKNEFTIRSNRKNNLTEFAKIIKGYGNYFFYGFANREESMLAFWRLLDLNEFRLSYMSQLYLGKHLEQKRSNKDGSSDFFVFNVNDFPDRLSIATSDPNC